jgi:hypothetical protein
MVREIATSKDQARGAKRFFNPHPEATETWRAIGRVKGGKRILLIVTTLAFLAAYPIALILTAVALRDGLTEWVLEPLRTSSIVQQIADDLGSENSPPSWRRKARLLVEPIHPILVTLLTVVVLAKPFAWAFVVVFRRARMRLLQEPWQKAFLDKRDLATRPWTRAILTQEPPPREECDA